MKNVLFVDDEPKVLEGLRRMLRAMRHEWKMEFVESGHEALNRLDAAPVDVVVTDMRMPGMDGSELLQEVRLRHPGTVRIVLSGQCERGSVLKCVGPTHQFLTKPCDSELLKTTVGRACRLRDHLPKEWIRQVISGIESVPSRPASRIALLAELASESSSIQRVGELVSTDVGMTAKVLQLVSSGFFGTPQLVSSVKQAVRLLGLETLGDLARNTNAFVSRDLQGTHQAPLDLVESHSRVVAQTAREIAAAETDDTMVIGHSYLAGLLHDVGLLILCDDSAESCPPILKLANFDGMTLPKAEQQTFNTTRAKVGAYLLGLWGLPDSIVKTVAYHLRPSAPLSPMSLPLAAVHVANAVLEESMEERNGIPSPLDTRYLEKLGFLDRLDRWRRTCLAVTAEEVNQ